VPDGLAIAITSFVHACGLQEQRVAPHRNILRARCTHSFGARLPALLLGIASIGLLISASFPTDVEGATHDPHG
jgi:hypothetical protein